MIVIFENKIEYIARLVFESPCTSATRSLNAGIAFFEASYWRENYQDISWEEGRGNRQ